MKKTEERVIFALGFLPQGIRERIINACKGRRKGLSGLREIRLRREGRAALTYEREKIHIPDSLSRTEMSDIVMGITGGALYAHRDDIGRGFISLRYGIRVGVVGTANYEGGRLVGVSEISSLLFRIPGESCDFSDKLIEIYKRSVLSGMLIYSPPGVGKTTALRFLARGLGSGMHPFSVAVVDERREFFASDYSGCDVDILSGYSKHTGIEIATRTMAPDVILIDEIGADEAKAIVGVLGSGVPIIATAHARSLEELMSKKSLSPLFEAGVFDVFVGISESEGGYALSVNGK